MNNLSFYLRNRKIVGWALIAISVGVSLITIYKGAFGDEADNLVVGGLILRGFALYRDVFSHHFPFPYYWMTIVIGLFGKSIFIARLSVLAFQTVAFVLSMRLSGDYLLVGVMAVIWSIVRSFYSGNMVIYSSFAGVSLLLILITILAILQQRISPSWKHWLVIGLFSVISILSDPLSVYAVAIAMFFLLTKKPVWGIYASLVIGGLLLLYVGVLFVTGSIQAFWSNTILFNSQIYAKYVYANPLRVGELYDMAIMGLGITDKTWLNLDPFKPITAGYTDLDRWFFTGFLYRFSVIATTLFLAAKKQFRAAFFMYLFAASVLIINPWDFRGQPFILVSLWAVSTLITFEWWHDTSNTSLKIFQIIIGFMVLAVTGWLCLRLSVNIYHKLNTYGESQFTEFKDNSTYIQQLTCHQPDVLLAHYPGGSYYYWFTGMKPVSKYVFMWPWVAEVGLEDVIDELGQKQTLAIVVMHETVIWDKYDTKVYLRLLHNLLEINYHKVAEGIYISPALYLRCSE